MGLILTISFLFFTLPQLAVLIFFFALAIVIYFSRPILLGLLKAKEHKDLIIKGKLGQLSTTLGLPNISLYETANFENNIFIFRPLFKGPCLVIGKGVFPGILTPIEFETIITSAVFRLRNKSFFLRTINTLLFSFIFFPIHFIRKNKNEETTFLMMFKKFFLSPFIYLREKFIVKGYQNLEFDKEFIRYSLKKRELYAAYYKISKMPLSNNTEISFFVDSFTYPLSIFPNKNKDLISYLSGGINSSENQLNQLMI